MTLSYDPQLWHPCCYSKVVCMKTLLLDLSSSAVYYLCQVDLGFRAVTLKTAAF